MKTRKAIEGEWKPKRREKMKEIIPFHLHSLFEALITGIDTKPVGETENGPKPNWNI